MAVELTTLEKMLVIALYFTLMVSLAFGYGRSWQKILQKQTNVKRSITEHGAYITPQARDWLFTRTSAN